MREVSCRALDYVLKAAKRRGAAPTILTEGVAYDIEYLRNDKNRIEWSAFTRVLTNCRQIWSLEEMSSASFMQTRSFSYVGVIARLLFTSRDLFDWMCKRSVGAGAQLFGTCVVPSFEHVGEDVTIIRLEIQPPHEVSMEFFGMTRGSFMSLPRLVGSGLADVDMQIDGRRATYHVRYKNRQSLLRFITWPFTARAAARELKDAHETLQARYEQLEGARTQLGRQATQLRTAHTVNQMIQRDLDLDRTIDAIARALVEEAGFAGAELDVSARVGDVAVARAVHHGDTGGKRLTRDLDVQGDRIGELRVYPRADADWVEREELLAFIVPTVAMALHNALSFHAVQDYRRGLERRVEERTYDLSLARDALAETIASREKLFQNISHEFRTPLALILLSVDTVATAARNRGDAPAVSHLATVTSSARKLVRMVDELLLLAAGRERELTVHPEPLDLHAAIAASTAGWRLAAEAAGQTLVVECPSQLAATADPIALERILANLLSNAVKFSPPGGKIAVTVTPGDRITIAVADTGMGIDDDLRKRLFGRFEQGAGGIASRGGSGIGLSLVRELARAHGGDVECVPNPGGGTVFRFTLAPAAALPVTGPAALRLAPGDFGVATDSQTVPSRLDPRGTSRGTILLAEDDLALAGSIARLLAGDHVILVAHDGAHALQLAEQHHPDLLITDVQMPGMDGFELTRRFREMPGVPPAPVLVLTARAGLDDRLTGFGVGAVDYLTKPFDPDELRARVRSQLAHRELTRHLYDAEKLAALGAMSAGLAHELRNPANGIVNAVAPLKEMLPPELCDPEHPVTQLIDVMAECADQVAYLSRQLLGFRRSGDLDLRRVPVNDVIERALANASAALTGIDLRQRNDYTGPIRCAAPVLSQVLTNLLENAAHAAGPGGWIEIATSKRPGKVTLEVVDSGPGVPPAIRDRIFEPFFTTKPPGQGTGLGLSTSRDLVHRHGGTLELRARDNRTVFAVELPEPPEVS